MIKPSYLKERTLLDEAWMKIYNGVVANARPFLDNAFLAGGCISSILAGEEPHDYDVYFRTVTAAQGFAEVYANLYNNNYQPQSPQTTIVVKTDGTSTVYHEIRALGSRQGFTHRPVDKEFGATAWTDYTLSLKGGYQFVTAFVDTPARVIANFDFAHCMVAYDPISHALKWYDEAATLQALLRKRLIYTGSAYPIASMIRAKKFMRRGFTFNAGQMLKVMFDIHALDLKNPQVLREQLVGVDVLYFASLLSRLQNDADMEQDLDDLHDLWQEIDLIFA